MDTGPDQRAIARELGISQSWVSLALRGSPRVPAATRERVLAAAARMGYRPDPLVAGLAQRRHRQHRVTPRLVWVGSADDPYLGDAQVRAAALGYDLELVPASGPDGLRAAQDGLAGRHVAGVVIGQAAPGDEQPTLLWHGIPAVQCGLYGRTAVQALVRPDLEAATRLCLEQVRAAGWARIICLQLHTPGTMSSQLVEDAALGQARRMGGIEVRSFAWSRREEAARWLIARKPEAVVGNTPAVLDDLRAVGGATAGALPFAAISGAGGRISGCDLRLAVCGSVAIDLLDGRIRRGERGLPETDMAVLIQPRWLRGSTLGVCQTGS